MITEVWIFYGKSMNFIKSLLMVSLVMLIGADALFAGGKQSGDSGSPDEKITITFAGTEGATSGQSRMMQEVADTLNATGRFDVNVYVAGALPGDTDNMVTQARQGVNLVVPSDPGRLASQFNIPDLNILMAPYVLMDYKSLEKLSQTDLYKEWQTALEQQGIILIADMFNGFRSFYTTFPVTKVADLSGRRIRGFGNAVGQALAKYLGYAQTTVTATDIYVAVQAKALDGCEIQASAANSYQLYEVTKNLILTRHYMLQSSFVCGKVLLESMPIKDRNLFIKTVYDAATKYSGIIAREEQGYYDGFKSKGVTVIEPDLAEFQKAIDPLYTNNDLKLTPGLKDRLFKELELQK
jgi:TRAP-type C4-dicarboxylate transport system substrate-binding protein